MRKIFALLASLFATVAMASTTYNLPSAAVYVNLASGNTTVGVGGVYYRAASQFVYFSDCPDPNTSRYRCSIQNENVTLYSSTGVPATANITAKFESLYVVSGHPYWRQAQTVLAGQVTVP